MKFYNYIIYTRRYGKNIAVEHHYSLNEAEENLHIIKLKYPLGASFWIEEI